MSGEGVYFVHKRTKVVLPEDQRVVDMKNNIEPTLSDKFVELENPSKPPDDSDDESTTKKSILTEESPVSYCSSQKSKKTNETADLSKPTDHSDNESTAEKSTQTDESTVSPSSSQGSKKRIDSAKKSSTKKKKKAKRTELLWDLLVDPKTGEAVNDHNVPMAPTPAGKRVTDNNPTLPEEGILVPNDKDGAMLHTRSNSICPHCGMRGNFCHNRRYGRYAILATICYRRATRTGYSDQAAKDCFLEAYSFAYEFEHFMQRCAIPAKMRTEAPECMIRSSMAIALIANNWEFFLHGLEKRSKKNKLSS